MLDPGDGSDIVSGGLGNDTADYSNRTAAVQLSLDSKANDGEIGEKDTLKIDVENLIGGDGADTLIGSSSPNELTGGLGADKLDGRAGDDALLGGRGDDILKGGTGHDELEGGAGNDTLSARDKTPDDVRGGAGRDTATVDRKGDTVAGDVERIRRA